VLRVPGAGSGALAPMRAHSATAQTTEAPKSLGLLSAMLISSLFFRIFEGTSAFPWKDVELYLCPSTSSQNNGGKPCNEKRDNRERES
jgi:hypothetical protein